MRELVFFWSEHRFCEAYESQTVWSVAGRFTGSVSRSGRTFHVCLRYNDVVDGEIIAETVIAWRECDGFNDGRRIIEDCIAKDERTRYFGFVVTSENVA